ncbi:zinc finger protein 26 [Manduca sexta]|nr:zinc finger protein 26 [Manduca sexta]XP_037297052.1 zinc finger protein 26 [Manduca sexta]XP_037297094.1 zinc finger protein 26 [Manduca sexta]
MFDIRACRACLSTKGKMEKVTELTKKTFNSITGLAITSVDGLPNYFCAECHTHLKKLLAFRRRCRRAHFVLKEILAVEKHVTLNNIMQVNRKRTNLKSPYTRNNSENMAYYTIDTITPDIDTIIASIDKYEPNVEEIVMTKKDIGTGKSILHIDIEPEHDTSIPNEETEIQDTEMTELEVPEELPETLDDTPMDFEDIPSPPSPPSPTPAAKSEDKTTDTHNEVYHKGHKKYLSRKVLEICAILAQTKIRMLDDTEQKEAFKKRMEEPWFKNARIKCALCLVVYDDIKQLVKHVNQHNQDIHFKFMCKVCKIKYCTEKELCTHISVSHLYEYKCKKCDAAPMYDLNVLIQHHKKEHPKPITVYESRMTCIKKHFHLKPCTKEETEMRRFLPEAVHRCRVCDTRFLSIGVLQQHLKKHAAPVSKESHQCDICRAHYRSARKLSSHVKSMHKYTYHCKQCPVVANNLLEAEFHMETHNSNFLCEFCDKQFRADSMLRKHRYSAHYTKTHNYHCNLCGESLPEEELLYQHQLSTHETISIDNPFEGDSEHYCKICSFQFLSKRAYEMHVLKHEHGDVASTLQNACNPCKMLFDSPEELEIHVRFDCKSTKCKINCAYCALEFESSREYHLHHKREHPKELYRPFNVKLCDQCGQTVADLNEHKRRHTSMAVAQESLECALCYPTRTFGDTRRFASHVVRVHTRRPYVCALCDVTFKWSSECRDHILKVHAPEQPYQCDFCSKLFSHGEFLKEHAMNVHKISMAAPRVDGKFTFTLYVYPQMKLNVSLLSKDVLAKITIELWDYLHEKKEVLQDFSDYVIVDKPEMGLKGALKKKKKAKKKEEVKVTEVVECLDNLEVIEQDGEQFVNIGGVLYRVEYGE